MAIFSRFSTKYNNVRLYYELYYGLYSGCTIVVL